MTANDRIALWTYRHVGTMQFFWVCVVVTGSVVFVPSLQWAREWVLLISSAVLQLAFLPLIMVGGRLESELAEKHRKELDEAADSRRQELFDAQEQRAAEDHQHLTAMFDLLRFVACSDPAECRALAEQELRELHPRGADRFAKD